MCWHNCSREAETKQEQDPLRQILAQSQHCPTTVVATTTKCLQSHPHLPSELKVTPLRAALPAIPLDNRGRARSRTQTHHSTCWCSLLSGSDSANFLFLLLFLLSWWQSPSPATPSGKYPAGSTVLWAWRYTSTALRQDWLHWDTPPPCTLHSLHLSPPPFSFPPPSHPSPSPVLSSNQRDSPPLPTRPFLLPVAALARWLTMPLQVNAGNGAKGRACSDLKREGQFTLQAAFGYTHARLHTDINRHHLNPPTPHPDTKWWFC